MGNALECESRRKPPVWLNALCNASYVEEEQEITTCYTTDEPSSSLKDEDEHVDTKQQAAMRDTTVQGTLTVAAAGVQMGCSLVLASTGGHVLLTTTLGALCAVRVLQVTYPIPTRCTLVAGSVGLGALGGDFLLQRMSAPAVHAGLTVAVLGAPIAMMCDKIVPLVKFKVMCGLLCIALHCPIGCVKLAGWLLSIMG